MESETTFKVGDRVRVVDAAEAAQWYIPKGIADSVGVMEVIRVWPSQGTVEAEGSSYYWPFSALQLIERDGKPVDQGGVAGEYKE
ncbi:MAG: hypothetical protein EBY40_01190, partial [Marivivens sp.]|nr:hypothetical protein [Marivivens sp.]